MSTSDPQVPQPDPQAPVAPDSSEISQNKSTDDLLQEILASHNQQSKELAEMRAEIAAQKSQATTPTPSASSVPQSAEDLAKQRADEISEADYYCPGCGALYNYQKQCTGRPEAPHPAVEVVSTDELKQDDTSKHTGVEYVNPQPGP